MPTTSMHNDTLRSEGSQQEEVLPAGVVDFAQELIKEFDTVEAFRIECCQKLMNIAKLTHELRKSLTDEMIEVLVEDDWRTGEVAKALAQSTAGLLKAIKAIEKPRKIEELFEPRYKNGGTDGL